MRVGYFDCFSGISGDMTLAALFDAGVPVEPVVAGIASLGLPVKVEAKKVRKGGFAATQVSIEAPHEHKHRHLPTPAPTPMALPPPMATTTSILWCSARARAASTASRGTCGSTSVNSAASRLPSEVRTRAAWLDPFRLGVQTKRTC